MSEISRVLKPGGRLFFEEVTSKALNRWFYRKFLDHPAPPYRFGKEEFVCELERQGIFVGSNLIERFSGDVLIGVGRRV